MAVLLLIDTMCIALLIVGLTCGLFIASQGEASILHPVNAWLQRYGKSEQLFGEWMRAEDDISDAGGKLASQAKMEALTILRDRARYRYNRYALWRKPLLLCIRCMPSLYGILIAVPMVIGGSSIVAAIIAIPMATTINTLLFNNIKLQ